MRNETKVGLLVVTAVVLLIIGYSYVSGRQIFSSTHTYYAVYDQVNGLQTSNPVLISGYRVGEVKEIQISDPSKPKILVEFTVKDDVQVPLGTTAQIYNSDLLGSKAVQLLVDSTNKKLHTHGDTLIADNQQSLTESISNELSPLKQKTSSLITQIDTLIRSVNIIMNEGGRDALAESIDNFNQSLQNLETSTEKVDNLLRDEQGDLQKTLSSISSVAENLDKQSKAINNTLSNLSNVSDSLAAANMKANLDTAGQAINRFHSIVQKIDEEKGTAGKLVNDPQLYYNLERSSAELDSLLNDIQRKPGRYVRFPIISFGGNN